jgi:hypothetical protein
LENIFHVARNFVPAQNAIEPLWPSLGEASDKAENRRKVCPRIVLSNPRRVQTRAVKSENLLARQLDNGGIFRERGQSRVLSYFQESLISGCRSVCQNSRYFHNPLLCVPASLREDLLIRRRVRA